MLEKKKINGKKELGVDLQCGKSIDGDYQKWRTPCWLAFYSRKKSKSGFSASSAGGFTSEKSFSLREILISSMAKGMLHFIH